MTIALSTSFGGHSNTTLKPWNPSFAELVTTFSAPKVGPKDGAYFIRGQHDGKAVRNDENIPAASLVIIDGDSRIDPETGEIHEGAPAIESAFEVLRDLDLQHVIFTSHSHGEKGNRWRAVLPLSRVLSKDSGELTACVDWLISQLHENGVWVQSVKENYAWSQPWYFPRLRSADAPFQVFHHDTDYLLVVEECLLWQGRQSKKNAVIVNAGNQATIVNDPASPIGSYNQCNGTPEAMLKMLVTHDYVFRGQRRINDEPAYVLLAPNSSSGNPGVVLFKSKQGPWRVCSHHGHESDPLAGLTEHGKHLAHDAFDIYCLLEHGGDRTKALKAWNVARDKRPVIKIFGGSLASNVSDAIRSLANQIPPVVLQRGPQLVRVAHLPEMTNVQGCTLPKGSAVIVGLTPPDMAVHLCAAAKWERSVEKDKEIVWVATDPTPKVGQGVLSAQGNWHGLPVLKAINETPILRPDGSLHDQVGYDPMTGLYYEGSCPGLSVSASPDKAEAIDAMNYIRSVFSEFPFVHADLGWSVTLGYMLTLMQRGQLPIAPLTAVSATSPGTGKGLLLEVCNLIVRGRDAAIMPPVSGNGSEEEIRKRITALLIQGATAVNLDNWSSAIGGDSFNALLTASEWSDRVLGRSEALKLPNRVTWAATGNNISVKGDMTRRTLLIQLDAAVERPEQRSFKVANLTQHVLACRKELLSALFTILRAYALAGRPEDHGPVLGRFEDWSRAVCAPIRWLGLPDPVSSQESLRKDDPEVGRLERLLESWYSLFGDAEMTVSRLVKEWESDFTDETIVSKSARASQLQDEAAFKEALADFAGEERLGKVAINSKGLGWKLKHFNGRVVAGLRLSRLEGERIKVPTYRVEKV